MRLLAAILLTGMLFGANGQTTEATSAPSWKGKLTSTVPTVLMPSFDVDAEKAIDDYNMIHHKELPFRFGYEHVVNYSLDNSGVWETIPNGDRIWRLQIKSRDALSLNLVLDEFQLPEGAELYFYSQDQTEIIGAYTSANNNLAGQLGTEIIFSEAAVLELYEPADVAGQSEVTIGQVVHGYREITAYVNGIAKALNTSGDCNIDVDCPLGSGWEFQRNSVAMIINGGGLCTGSLVNNTANDGTPYFITANHCGTNYASATFRFRWESPNPVCATTASSTNGPTTMTVNGAITRASNSSSDFCLVELNSSPNPAWNIYYNGWDNSESLPTQGTGIHHPDGDIKKICRDNDGAVQQTLSFNGDPNTRVWYISEWEQGVTEPGSSGSPLFDQNKRLIGVLSGGAAACSGTVNNGQYDFYGRFGIAWDLGSSASTRAEDWLDPSNSGVTTLDGYDPNTPTTATDAGITNVITPTGTFCGSSITPEVTLRNYGSNTLTSVDITYTIDGGTPVVYNWTGSLATAATTTVTLATATVTNGAHTFDVATSNPNGTTDDDTNNDDASSSFTAVVGGEVANLALTLDCYGDEVTWEVVPQGGGAALYSGGPYTNSASQVVINESFCLAVGCYDFIIYDSYGDGLNGSAAWGCSIDGDYEITDGTGAVLCSMIATDADYGSQENNSFCLTSPVNADFSASATDVCEGTTVAFTDLSNGPNTITGWDWSFPGGSPATSTQQNPVVVYNTPGTYDVTLTATDGSGSGTVTMTGFIVVNANPTPSISGLTDYCTGFCATLDAGSFTSYAWSNGGTSQTDCFTTADNPISVTVTDANGCSGASATVNVTDVGGITPVVAGPANYCAGGNVSLDAGSGYASYSWSNGSTSQTINATSADSPITVTVTDASGCSGTSSAFTITENPTPSASASVTQDALCSGSCDGQATATATGGTSPYNYSWSQGSTGGAVTGLCAGSHTVTVTDINGCTGQSTISVVEPTAISITGSSTSDNGTTNGTVDITVGGGTGAYTYSWSHGASTEDVSNLAAGTYTVTVTDANGCSDSQTFTVISSVGIVENALEELRLYPNPAKDYLIVDLGEYTSGFDVRILDVNGRIVLERDSVMQGQVALPVAQLAQGTYAVRIFTENGSRTARIVVE